jgi:predicted MPP superfamily phosphohydrolase
MRSLKKSKITFLDNRNVTYKELNIIGLTDRNSDLNKIESAKKMVDESLYNVCLVHQPSIWDELCTDIDIMLSGHTHNGQIFPFNLLVKIKFKYIYGLYKRENNLLYVSSGSGTWGPKMRLGSFNEIISLKLSNEGKL